MLRLCKLLSISSISLLCTLDVAFCTIVIPHYGGFKDRIRSNSSHNTAVIKKLHRKPIRLFDTKSNDWPHFVHLSFWIISLDETQMKTMFWALNEHRMKTCSNNIFDEPSKVKRWTFDLTKSLFLGVSLVDIFAPFISSLIYSFA